MVYTNIRREVGGTKNNGKKTKDTPRIELEDETDKVFLNTSGTLNDVDDEMLEFLNYVEQSTDEVAERAKSELVKTINQKVNHVKHDKTMEVEYMVLLERDRINFEEGVAEGIEKGIEKGKIEEKVQMAKKLLVRGMSIDEISLITELTREEVESLVK